MCQQKGKTVIPSAQILSIIQDKGRQKQFYADHSLATAPFILVSNENAKDADLQMFTGNKVVAKICRGGYDGKGVTILSKDDILAGKVSDYFSGDVILEQFIDDAIELAVIVARNANGEIKCYPAVEMVFDPAINLVDYLFAPSSVSNEIQEDAKSLALNAIDAMKGIGIFAVELFVKPDRTCIINEIAPRPHNSGHHTIEACYTSQYEQLTRIMLGLPLGKTDLISPAVMTNILGSDDVRGDYQLNGLKDLTQTPGAYLHWYNKSVSKPGRKMGHFTVLDSDLTSAIKKSRLLKEKLKTAKPS